MKSLTKWPLSLLSLFLIFFIVQQHLILETNNLVPIIIAIWSMKIVIVLICYHLLPMILIFSNETFKFLAITFQYKIMFWENIYAKHIFKNIKKDETWTLFSKWIIIFESQPNALLTILKNVFGVVAKYIN